MTIQEIRKYHSVKHRGHEKRATKLISKALLYQAKKISNFVKQSGTGPTLSNLNRLIEIYPIKAALNHIWETVGKDYSNIELHINKEHTPKKNYLQDYAEGPKAAAKIVGINETTRIKVQSLLKKGAIDKLNKKDLAKLIESSEIFGKKRSLLIARTETTMAANMGAYGAAKNSGIKLDKLWLATSDEKTREWHADVLYEPIGIDDYFLVNGQEMLHPGDPNGSPDNVCNCRCVLTFTPSKKVIDQIPESDTGVSNPKNPSQGGRRAYNNEVDHEAIAAALAAIITRITEGELEGTDEGNNL